MTIKFAKYCSMAAFALAVVATSASCSREEDDIWDQSAAERLNAIRDTYRDALCAAPNGWEMYYFCSNDEMGYNFLVKFENGDEVTVATRNTNTNNAYAEETSAFDVIADDGPVLSFNTYNTLLHLYSDPDPGHNEASDGVGSGGDYEFKMMTVSDTMIYMRGKKTGIEVYMYPLAENVSWEQYFEDLNTNRNEMFNRSIPTLWLELADGVRYSISNAYSQIMSFVPEGGDAITQTSTMSCVLTPNGFRWLHNFPGDTVTTTPAREFEWNADHSYLVSTSFSGNNEKAVAGATIKAPSFATMLSTTGLDWRTYQDDTNGSYNTAFQELKDAFTAYRSNYILQYLHYYFNVTLQRPCLGIYVTAGRNRFEYTFYGDMTTDGERQMTLSFSGEGDSNATSVIAAVPEIADFLNAVSASYTLSSSSEICPNRILLTNTSNNDSFYVALQ